MEILLFDQQPTHVEANYSYRYWANPTEIKDSLGLGSNYIFDASKGPLYDYLPEGYTLLTGEQLALQEGWVTLESDKFQITMAMHNGYPNFVEREWMEKDYSNFHYPQDAVCATILKIKFDDGNEQEIPIIAYADGMSLTLDEAGKNEIRSETSGLMSKEAVVIAIQSIADEIKATGSYSTKDIPSKIREVWAKKGLENGATTLNIAVFVPDEISDTGYEVYTHSFAGTSDNGLMMHFQDKLLMSPGSTQKLGYRLRYFIQPENTRYKSDGEKRFGDQSFDDYFYTEDELCFITDGVRGYIYDDKTMIMIRRKRRNLDN